MKVIKLNPSGFCFGVELSYNKTLEIVNNHKNNRVLMIGWLVHNEYVINKFIEKGIEVLDDKDQSRIDIINNLANAKENDAIIFSAHGTQAQAIELAKAKGYVVYDLTCPYVYKTHKLIKNKLKNNYDIFFIGKHKHPETIAIMSIDKNIKLIENENDVVISNNKKSFCTNQTTLSVTETKNLYDRIKAKNSEIEIVNDICDETTRRQEALIKMDKDVDLCLIVADQKSSNANELLKIAKNKCESYLIKSKDYIEQHWLNNKNKVCVIGAASTPIELIDDVYEFLLKFN